MKFRVFSCLIVSFISTAAQAGDVICTTKKGSTAFQFQVSFDPYSSPNWARNIISFQGMGVGPVERHVWIGGRYNEPQLTMIHDAESGDLIEVHLRTDLIPNQEYGNALATGYVVDLRTNLKKSFHERMSCTF